MQNLNAKIKDDQKVGKASDCETMQRIQMIANDYMLYVD